MSTSASQDNVLKPVAIVGIAVELPSGCVSDRNLDHASFFQFLLDKQQAYEKIPRERFNIDSWKGRGWGQVITDSGSFLKDLSMFDHLEFGVTAKDARAMAVSTRKLIELSFLALLDSGINYRGQRVGCYASGNPFDILSIADPDEFEARGSFAGIPCMVANKISYHLDLLGPSVPTDTACSSSLTALHLAVQAIRAGDCEAAVVGGCQLNHRFIDFVQYSQGGVLAPDGKCKPFDSHADGFSRGEGAVVIVIKSLEDAIRDHDHIYASILGSAINSGGSGAPVNAPIAEAQADAMQQAFYGTGRTPAEVDFVELHATGTAAGDPAEANWVGERFKRDDEILVGSVKGNIGHLEITAFLASLSKICSMFRARTIPPNVNLNIANPAIKWDEYRLRVPLDAMPLPARHRSGRPLISMSSSGIGGANGHVVLEGPPESNTHQDKRIVEIPLILIAGGLSPRSVASIAETLAEFASEDDTDMLSISTLYGRRSRQMTWRAFSIFLPGRSDIPRFTQPTLISRTKPPLVFLFSGQGPQHIEMGRQLYRAYPQFRRSIQHMDKHYETIVGKSLIKTTGLFSDGDVQRTPLGDVWPIEIILPSIAMLQMALFDLLRSIGIVPDIVIGHSAGETAMIYASGAAPLEMALEIAIARGLATSLAEGAGGAMAALACSPEDARILINTVVGEQGGGVLEVACFNAQEAVTLAGDEHLVDRAVQVAQEKGYFARKIRTRVAVHSSLMDICRERYHELIEDVFSRYPGIHRPKTVAYSTLTGDLFDERFTQEYFWDNTRMPVMFTQAVTSLLKRTPTAAFVEIGAHPALASYLSALGVSRPSICPMRRAKVLQPFHEPQVFLESVGLLSNLGYNFIDFNSLNGCSSLDSHSSIPVYPFLRKHIPYYPDSSSIVARQNETRNGPLNHKRLRMNAQSHPTLAQHVIRGEAIMPAAGFIEMGFEFGARTLWNVVFRSMMSLPSDKVISIHVDTDGCYWSVRSTAFDNLTSRLHADGYMSLTSPQQHFHDVDLSAIKVRCSSFNVGKFYTTLGYFANYGPIFQRVTACYKGEDEALVQIRGASSDLHDLNDYVIHPAILDCCIHVMVHPAFTGNADRNVYYLPSRAASVILHEHRFAGPFPEIIFAHVTFRQWSPDGLVFDFIVTDEQGLRLCTISGFEVAAHYATVAPLDMKDRYDFIYQPLSAPPYAPRVLEPMQQIDARGLFGLLDRVVSRTAMIDDDPQSEKAANMDELRIWSEHVDMVDTVESFVRGQSDKKSTAGIRSLTIGLSECLDVFGNVFTAMTVDGGKKVVRILELGEGCLMESLRQMLSQSPTVSSTLVSTGVSKTFESGSAAASRLMYDLDRSPEEQAIPLASFDIIVGFHALATVADLPTTLASLHRLLLPGGSLILSEICSPPWSPSQEASAWNNYLLAPCGGWPGLFGGRESHHHPVPLWQKMFIQAGFRTIDNHTHDHLFVTLSSQKDTFSITQSRARDVQQAPVVFSFRNGEEMRLQAQLVKRDDERTIWIEASSDFHGAAARGFSRALRKEFFSRQIRLVLFDTRWAAEQRLSAIHQMSEVPELEHEILIDVDGKLFVPRIVLSSPPIKTNTFKKDTYWVDTQFGLTYPPVPNHLPQQHVFVRITSFSQLNDGFRSFAGYVENSGGTGWSAGTAVVGLTDDPLSNYLLVHEGRLGHFPQNCNPDALLGVLPAVLIAPLAFGIGSIIRPERMNAVRLLITNDDTSVGRCLVWIFTCLGLKPTSISSVVSVEDFGLVTASDVVISGFLNQDRQILESLLAAGARTFFWNDSFTGVLAALSKDPWLFGDIFSQMIEVFPDIPKSLTLIPCVPPEDHLPMNIHVQSKLFDDTKAYLLVGGIGSLGIHIALWMYQKGAREIILTSRSGRSSLIRVRNVIGLRILSYLEKLPDLNIRLESCDASSPQATGALVASIARPIAGCMLLSVTLSDCPFTSHTAESYGIPFPSKKGAFEALRAVVPLEKLDFLITLSSAATLGNAGQTNYASANTLIDELTRPYANAFSLIAPAIIDTSTIANTEDLSTDMRLKHWASWAMSSSQICDCIEDGILMLRDRSFWLYVPDFDWPKMRDQFGPSPMYDHLVHVGHTSESVTPEDSSLSLQSVVLQFLDVTPEEFSPRVPFTAYGLDSLSAGRLAFSLKPFLSISQLQLLADISLDDLQERIEKARDSMASAQLAGQGPNHVDTGLQN